MIINSDIIGYGFHLSERDSEADAICYIGVINNTWFNFDINIDCDGNQVIILYNSFGVIANEVMSSPEQLRLFLLQNGIEKQKIIRD